MQQTNLGVSLVGCGSARLPIALTNDDLSQMVETSDEWIATRTGIRLRYVASHQDSLSSLATDAAHHALQMASMGAGEVDLIILATSSPDDLFGSAAQVQASLGASRAVAFDLTAACSGFVFALVTAAQYMRLGVYQTVLVIGADVLSRWTDWHDRRTCVLFGDGAGAVVLQASDRDHLRGFELRSDGTLNGCLNLPYQATGEMLVPGKTAQKGTYQPISMNGKEVYRFAVKQVPEIIEKALFRAELTTQDVDWLLLHQANQRILDAVASRLNIADEKVISNMERYGNTSAASIAIALDEAVRDGRIKPGDIIACSGFGAGLSWGAAIFEWGSSSASGG
ncbi:MAG: beta-ketoacyl-ACP synthase III [Leptolyngbyaceae cyanobacterium]